MLCKDLLRCLAVCALGVGCLVPEMVYCLVYYCREWCRKVHGACALALDMQAQIIVLAPYYGLRTYINIWLLHMSSMNIQTYAPYILLPFKGFFVR